MMRRIFIAVLILSLPSVVAITVYYYAIKRTPTRRDSIGTVATVAGTGHPGLEDGTRQTASFSDPFGIAVDKNGNVMVADAGDSNRIKRISAQGNVETLAGSSEGNADGPAPLAQFNTPSGIAFDKADNLIIADTSNHRLRKLTVESNTVTTIAGSGRAGFKDGAANDAEFDGPIGVAVDKQKNVIFVADSYNDRIRKIAPDGSVTTLAGTGTPGFKDGDGVSAMFDTPCGVAVDKDGNLFVADTGNNAIRKITPQGEVTTLAKDQQGSDARLIRPIGVVVTHDGFLFITTRSSNQVIRIAPEGGLSVFAGAGAGFADGAGAGARFNGPSGIALDRDGVMYVADAQNYLIRMLKPTDPNPTEAAASQAPDLFIQPPTEPVTGRGDQVIPKLSPASLNLGPVFPWPLAPQGQWHEIAGVVGEARGAPGGIALDHLHSGLDVRGQMGEPAVSVLDEKVNSPISAWGLDQSSEGVRIGLMSYIHVRVGRDANNQLQAPDKFKPRVDETGKLVAIRVRRGARFKVGDFVGTLNQLYHVHLNLGPPAAQANPIQFPFPNFKDTLAPHIEPDGIEVIGADGKPMREKRAGRLVVAGDVKLLVTAYDRVEGNAAGRKLGLYRLGYQLLKEDGTPVGGYEQPLMNIEFNRLPADDAAASIVYAAGSGVSAYGTPTKFKYIATNRVRDGEAREGVLRTINLAPGNYLIRVIAEDYAGNRASGKATELPITIGK
jgi:DNA-binding beta-propeller fold protein YncE